MRRIFLQSTRLNETFVSCSRALFVFVLSTQKGEGRLQAKERIKGCQRLRKQSIFLQDFLEARLNPTLFGRKNTEGKGRLVSK